MSADLLATALPTPRPERSRPDRRLRAVEAPARRPRRVYGIVAVTGALLIAGAQMGLSILTTQSSYELSALTTQAKQIDWQKQMLQDELAGLSSPQYLAANAEALGMITGQAPTYLRLSDAAIIGTGIATGTTSIHALSRAAVPNKLVGGVPLVTDPASSLSAGTVVEDEAIANISTPPPIADGLPTPDTH